MEDSKAEEEGEEEEMEGVMDILFVTILWKKFISRVTVKI